MPAGISVILEYHNSNGNFNIVLNEAIGSSKINGYKIMLEKYNNKSIDTSSQETGPSSVFFKPDGTKLYILGTTNDTVYQYTLSTAWDISTASYDSKSFSAGSEDTNPLGFDMNPDGYSFIVVGNTNNRVYQYTMSTQWDISTASYDSISHLVGNQLSIPTGVRFSDNGHRFYVVGQTPGDFVHQYRSNFLSA